MPIAVRSLLTGLFVGVLVALLLPQLTPHIPLSVSESSSRGSPANRTPLPDSSSMAQVLRSLARNVVRGASGGSSGASTYKSTIAAASSPVLLSRSTLASTTSKISSASSASFSTSSPTNMASSQLTKSVLEAIKERRTYYQLNKESPISDAKISELVEQALLHVPSSFNSQSTRLVVLLNQDHEKFWDYVVEVLKPLTPEDKFDGTKQKINGFKAAYGTVLFYEAPEPVDALKTQFPLYAHHFGDWSEHTNAMHQYALWVALEAEGFGANLQHYNPIIDQKAAEHWNIPLEWKLRSQLVFGGRAGSPGDKAFQKTFGERLFVHGAKE